MRWFAAPDYWFARLAFQRGLAVIYLIAFARTPGDRGLVASLADPRLRPARHPAAAGSGNLTCDP